MVEAQHKISTSRLADNPLDEERLEGLVERVKPEVPAAAAKLHYLLRTPFRYGFQRASRFRRAEDRPGIFYASEHLETCLAEAAYWRCHFFAASPGVLLPTTTAEYLAFTVAVSSGKALDLTALPFLKSRSLWTRSNDYRPCQDFAAAARTIEAALIRYESVRDAKARANVAILDPSIFTDKVPRSQQGWHLRFQDEGLTAIASAPSMLRYRFTFAQFGLAALR